MTVTLRQRPLARVVQGIVQAANGTILEVNDMSYLYQDAAGTTPVTAVEQPVGKIIDKSGNGNHATQSVTASRPTLSARYNLLTKTEDFSNSAWIKDFSGTGAAPVVTTNYATAPDGSNTAARIVYALNGGSTVSDFSRIAQSSVVAANTNTTLGVWLKSTDGTTKKILISMAGEVIKLVDVGNNWLFVAHTMFRADTNYSVRIELRGTFGTSDSADILIWHPDLRLGTTPGPYQRVNTVTDYDTDERYFPKYLRFDGVDDYLNLPYMGLYGGGAASIIAARNAVSQATGTYIISERSTTNANPKYFPSRQLASGGNMDSYISDDTAAVVLDTAGSAFSGASDKVIRSVVDSGNNIKLFKNGVLAADNNYTRSGTLTLNNTTIGASVSTTTSNYASMKLYSLIITKSALTDAQRVRCERFLARKAGVML